MVRGRVVEPSSVTAATRTWSSSGSFSRPEGMVEASAVVVLFETALATTSTVPPAWIFPVVVIDASLSELTTITARAPTSWFLLLFVFASVIVPVYPFP